MDGPSVQMTNDDFTSRVRLQRPKGPKAKQSKPHIHTDLAHQHRHLKDHFCILTIFSKSTQENPKRMFQAQGKGTQSLSPTLSDPSTQRTWLNQHPKETHHLKLLPSLSLQLITKNVRLALHLSTASPLLLPSPLTLLLSHRQDLITPLRTGLSPTSPQCHHYQQVGPAARFPSQEVH